MKRTDKRTRDLTARLITYGQSKAEVASLVARLRKPTRKLGGVSDMHIEQMENMTPEELEALELGSP